MTPLHLRPLRMHASARDVDPREAEVAGCGWWQADGSLIDAELAVLSGGSWARELLPIPVLPIKGQMLALRPTATAAAEERLERVLYSSNCYIIPRSDGRIVVGATEEPDAGYCREPTAAGIHSLLSKAMATVCPTISAHSDSN